MKVTVWVPSLDEEGGWAGVFKGIDHWYVDEDHCLVLFNKDGESVAQFAKWDFVLRDNGVKWEAV